MGKSKILHIAAHMGEGVGKAISGLAIADTSNEHEIILVDEPNKTNFIDYARNNGISVIVCPENSLLTERISDCDIVVTSWWNHPSMVPILHKFCDIPARLLLWSHVNGLKYPQLAAKFASIFDLCLFTSPISLRPPHWTDGETADIQRKSELVYGMGEFKPREQPFKNIYKLHDPIRIGYVGTLNYAKLHPDFMTYCKTVLNRGINACFALAGEASPLLIESVKRENLSDRFELLGFRNDIPELLTTFDVFGYLLNPNNFATTENALLEAMAAGLPIITGNSEAERTIIADGKNGFTVTNAIEYAKRIAELAQNLELRTKIGNGARESVCEKYDVVNNVKRFNNAVTRTMEKNKTTHDFSSALGSTPFEYFLTSCPANVRSVFTEAADCNSSERFCQLKEKAITFDDLFKTNRKGSAFQFLSYFPSNIKLKKICELFEYEIKYEGKNRNALP